EIKIRKNSFILLICISILVVINLINEYENSLFFYIVLNLIIIKISIINYIKNFGIELKRDRQKLNVNKKYTSLSINEINLECNLQKQYKDEILDLNNKINKFIEKSDNPIFVLNVNKQYIYSNQAFKNFIKLDKVSERETDIFSYLDWKFINGNEIIKRIKDINTNSSKTVKSYDGKIYKFACVRDIIDGRSVIICILRDITQSTLIQNKLKESEEKYKKLMDILNDGVMIHNMNTINYINNKAIEIFNLEEHTKKIVLIDDIRENISKKFRQEFIENINLVQLGKKDKATIKIETEEGKTIEFITTSIVLNNTNMLLSIAIDVSTLENALTDIEQSEKTYKLLLQTLPEGIIIIDKKTNNYIYRNKAMIKILKNIGVENLNNIIKNYLNKCEYGKFKKFSINIEEIRDVDVAIIDRTEENIFVVVVRTLDDKYKAEKMKERLDEISDKCRFKTEFLANLANDIKKPINTIFETNKILYMNKDKYDSQYIDNYTMLVKQNCYRLMRLLGNIQEIGNLENETYTMNIKKYDMIKLAKNLVEKSKRYTDEKGLSIKFESNIDKKILAIDKEKIEKIILNLLSNSIKFTEKGGKIILSVFSENEEFCICVKDTGIGIPKDKIDVIFESFEQVDRTLSRGAEGSGIGLSLVKKLVDAHNATISVKSEVGIGSEFKIILEDNLHQKQLINEVDSGCDFSDNEKIDIEFSDIYFNYSY
ncbi:PAS domain-containing sensor histidine kinase, partial [Romboutsia sp.]|uniref:PAS domain-containing sensor histidine kinase n=1 Tax=Romboutsia sp. TaxID=1965302 RepID=UPI002BC0051D